MSALISYGFISSHKGGQHTNGPDYGVVTGDCELTGVRIEIQTSTSLHPHRARDLIASLIDLANQEMGQ